MLATIIHAPRTSVSSPCPIPCCRPAATPSSRWSPRACAVPTCGRTAASPRPTSRTASGTSSSGSSRRSAPRSQVRPGDFVIAPFCQRQHVRQLPQRHTTTSCVHGSWWGGDDARRLRRRRAGRARARPDRRRHARGAEAPIADDSSPALLTLSDVMGTGHHAAVSAGSARRHCRRGRRRRGRPVRGAGCADGWAPTRSSRCRGIRAGRTRRDFGATDIVEERGDDGRDRVREITGGVGADRVLECVGTKESMRQAIRSTRPGDRSATWALPTADPSCPASCSTATSRQRRHRAGARLHRGAAARRTVRRDRPGRVFDLELPLREAAGLRRDGRAPRDQGAAAPLRRTRRADAPAPRFTRRCRRASR